MVTLTSTPFSEDLASGYGLETPRQLYPELYANVAASAGTTLPSSSAWSGVTLADGSEYQIKYNSYGEVARLELPTGGAYEFTWGRTGGGAAGEDLNNLAILRGVTEIRDYPDGHTLARREDIAYSTQDGASGATTSSTMVDEYDAAGNRLRTVKHYFYYVPPQYHDPLSHNAWKDGLEYKTEVYSGSGVLLKSTANSWQQKGTLPWADQGNPFLGDANTQQAYDPRIVQIDTTLGDGSVSGVALAYDQFNNVTDRYEYDFGQGSPGSLVRHTATSYVTASSYLNAPVHLLRMPSQATTYSAAATAVSLTYYSYDETVLANDQDIVGHDGAFGATYTARGNLTTKKDYINTSNSYSITKYEYDIAGNVTSITDANGNTPTKFTYNDTCDLYARPLTITNSASQSTILGYDNGTTCYNGTGNLTSSIDPNGVKTAYSYSDSLDRLTQIRRAADTAAESQTNIVYNGSTDVNVYNDQATKGDRKLHRETLYDGFGRENESRQYESSGTYIFTTKVYDALGRLSIATNPSRMTNGQSDGLGYATTTSYDALGRVVSVKTADGSTTATSYTGSQTTITDPAGKKRQYTYL